MTDQDCLLTDCWPLRALAWLAVAGWTGGASVTPSGSTFRDCLRTRRQAKSVRRWPRTCLHTADKSRDKIRHEDCTCRHEVPAECASVEAAGARVSARCPPWAASPWRSAARHSRGGRNHGRSAGNGSWPAEMARRHLFPPPGLFLGLFERAKQTDSEGTLREGTATHRQVFYPRRQTRWPAGKSGKLSAGRSPPPPPG